MTSWTVSSELLSDEAFASVLRHGSPSTLAVTASAERRARIETEQMLVFFFQQYVRADADSLRLMQALKPFADTAEAWQDYPDEERLVESWPHAEEGQVALCVGHLRAAKKAYGIDAHQTVSS